MEKLTTSTEEKCCLQLPPSPWGRLGVAFLNRSKLLPQRVAVKQKQTKKQVSTAFLQFEVL